MLKPSQPQHSLILGIETALALYNDQGLLGDVLYSQIDSHQTYGGVVPELAAREHLLKLDPLLCALLEKTHTQITDITHIAYTRGPGLIGALLVGANYASALATGLQCPLLGINHLEAHIASPFINQDFPQAPFLTLLISGGHTQIIYTHQFGQYEIIGETLDDAIGEAFDKTAKIMGLPYPGGPMIEQLALKSTHTVDLPRPMQKRRDAMMSFSGLKTATRLAYEKYAQEPNAQENIAASLQTAIADVLISKLEYAITQTNAQHLVVSGGVSANHYIRQRLQSLPIANIDFPEGKFCTDNAAMVAYVGYLRQNEPPPKTLAQARWRVDEI